VRGAERCEWESTIPSATASAAAAASDRSDGRHDSRLIDGHSGVSGGVSGSAERFSGKHTFFKSKVALHTWRGGSIPSGQYAFPFTFELPDELPGSFREEE
jgi:hypothetical protein